MTTVETHGRMIRASVGLTVVLVAFGLVKPARAQKFSGDQSAAVAERDKLQQQAQELLAAGKLPETIAAIEKKLAFDQRTFGDDSIPVAETLGALSLLQIKLDDFESACDSAERAFDCWRKRLGDRHWRVVDARLARDHAIQLSRMDRAQRRQLADADRDSTRVIPLAQAGSAADAIALATRVRDVYQSLVGKHHSSYVDALDHLARAIEVRGDHAAARKLLEEAVVLRKAIYGPDHPHYAVGLNSLGQVLQELGEYDLARQLFENALRINRAALGENNIACATVLHNLAFVVSEQGDYATARRLFEKSLTIVRTLVGEEHPLYANGLSNMAHLLREMHDYAGARPLYEKVLAVLRGLPGGARRPDYAAAMRELAYVLRQQGEMNAAVSLYQQMLDQHKETVGEHHPAYIGTLSNLATCLLEQGQVDLASPVCEKAAKLAEVTWGKHHPEYARAIGLLGEVRRARNDYAGARSLAEEAVSITRATRGDRHPYFRATLANLAILRWEQSDYVGAAALLEQALEIAEYNLELSATSQSERQQLAMANGFRSALDDYLSIASLAGVPADKVYAHILVMKGAILARQGLVGLKYRIVQKQPRSAAAVVFAAWQQATVELAALAGAGPTSGHEEEWKSQLAALSNKRDDAESALGRTDASFRAARAEARRTPKEIQAALPNDTALIDFVEYKHVSVSARKWPPAKTRVLAFVARSGRPIRSLDLGPKEPIAKAIEGWRVELIRHDGGSDEPAHELHRLVWAPLEPHLDGLKTVLISPDGAISRAPLTALPGSRPGTYLIEEITIAVIPAPRMLKTGRDQVEHGKTASTLLLVGDVDFGAPAGSVEKRGLSRSALKSNERGRNMTYGRLPATSAEVAGIARVYQARFPEGVVVSLTGPAATESALRQAAPNCRVLHLATHGFFDPTSQRFDFAAQSSARTGPRIDPFGGQRLVDFYPGLLSGIALAGANRPQVSAGQDDGVLTALEVAVLDLSQCDLAVLSACETGLGKAAGGEGLLGLQRAFQVANAKTVVASLWSVNDDATGLLITEFYRNLWERNLPKGESLRQAQLKMLRGGLRPDESTAKRPRGLKRPDAPQDYRKPYYWAAFELSGDSG